MDKVTKDVYAVDDSPFTSWMGDRGERVAIVEVSEDGTEETFKVDNDPFTSWMGEKGELVSTTETRDDK